MQILSKIDRINKKISSPKHSQYLYFTKVNIENSHDVLATPQQNKPLKIKFVQIPKDLTSGLSGNEDLVCELLANVGSCLEFGKMRQIGILKLEPRFWRRERARRVLRTIDLSSFMHLASIWQC